MNIERLIVKDDYPVFNFMTDELLEWVLWTLSPDAPRVGDFYRSKVWRHAREIIMEYDQRTGCVATAAAGWYAQAQTVHHVCRLHVTPALALSSTYTLDGVMYRQLISLTAAAHDLLHQTKPKNYDVIRFPERW